MSAHESDVAFIRDVVMGNIARQRQALAHALDSEWLDVARLRAWHACYYVAPLDEWRVAVLFQWRGDSSFKVGVIRDASDGGQQELQSIAMTTLAAVVFCGLHYVHDAVEWRQEL